MRCRPQVPALPLPDGAGVGWANRASGAGVCHGSRPVPAWPASIRSTLQGIFRAPPPGPRYLTDDRCCPLLSLCTVNLAGGRCAAPRPSRRPVPEAQSERARVDRLHTFNRVAAALHDAVHHALGERVPRIKRLGSARPDAVGESRVADVGRGLVGARHRRRGGLPRKLRPLAPEAGLPQAGGLGLGGRGAPRPGCRRAAQPLSAGRRVSFFLASTPVLDGCRCGRTTRRSVQGGSLRGGKPCQAGGHVSTLRRPWWRGIGGDPGSA